LGISYGAPGVNHRQHHHSVSAPAFPSAIFHPVQLLFSARYRPFLATCLAAPRQHDGTARDGHLRMHGAFGSAVDALRRNREANRCRWQNRRSLALLSLLAGGFYAGFASGGDANTGRGAWIDDAELATYEPRQGQARETAGE
jgi:hypothetical protein